MSFSQEVKAEISQNILRDCCKKAQLAAFLQLASSISINQSGMTLLIKTENATTAKRIWILIKEVYQVETELSVMKKMKLKKNNVYYVRVLNQAKEILEDIGLLTEKGIGTRPKSQLVKKECCARAYLAGAFLATGSINSPLKSNYHLEIAANEQDHANYIEKIMHRFDLPAKQTKRRNQYVIYLKVSEKISDFLRLIGTYNAVLNFEDQRIQRDFRNSFTRLDNCELANEVKTIEAGKKQLEDIQCLQDAGRFEMMDKKLIEVANLRIEFPEYSLNELCEEYQRQTENEISKSGMKHRFTKIKTLAEEIRKQK